MSVSRLAAVWTLTWMKVMPKLFGVDIAGEIAKGFAAAGGLAPGVLIKETPGTRDPNNLTAVPEPTQARSTFQGYLEQGQMRLPGSRAVVTGDFVFILGASVAPFVVPSVNDKVEIEDAEWELTELMERDPAAASYLFRVQGGKDAS